MFIIGSSIKYYLKSQEGLEQAEEDLQLNSFGRP
jgi:hypothetical protein